MEHTPTPWKANGDFILHSSSGTHIATTMPAELPVTPQSVANAEFIVRACNAFKELVELLKTGIRLNGTKSQEILWDNFWKDADIALTKVTGKE